MRRLKKKTAKVLAVMMAAAITFTSLPAAGLGPITARAEITGEQDRKSTRLNSSH